MAMTEEERKERKRVSGKKYRLNNPKKIAIHKKRYQESHKAEIAEYKMGWRERNAEHIKEYYQEYQKQNLGSITERGRRYRENSPEKVKVSGRLSRAKHAQKSNAQARAKQNIEREVLGDNYIKALLANKSNLSRSHIPQDLIDLKREHLKITRILKERKQNG
jgi:hypothetical protein